MILQKLLEIIKEAIKVIEKNLKYVSLRRHGTAFLDAFGFFPIDYFGCVGDNHHDNYANLQVAINESVKKGNKYLFVPQGEYFYTGELVDAEKLIWVGNADYARVYSDDGEIPIYQIGTFVDIGVIEEKIEEALEYKGDSQSITEETVVEEGYFDIETDIENATDAYVITEETTFQIIGDLVLRDGKIWYGIPMSSPPPGTDTRTYIGENVYVWKMEIIENAVRVYYRIKQGETEGTISTIFYWRVR